MFGWRPSQPPPGPQTVESLSKWVMDEFNRLATADESVMHVQFAIRHEPPVKPREGEVLAADGTNWDPGGGRGIYVFLSGGWVKL